MSIYSVGSTVLIEPLAPFTNLYSSLEYTILKSELISVAISSGEDILTDVYKRVGLTVVDMNNDAINKLARKA